MLATRLVALGVLLSSLSGCTGDGYLGEIDEKEQERRAEERAADLWRAAASAHPVTFTAAARVVSLSGDLAPFALPVATFGPVPGEPDASTGPGAPPPMRAARLERLAIAGALLEGERGWLVLDGPSATLAAVAEGEGLLVEPTLVSTSSGRLAAVVGAGWGSRLDPIGCFDAPSAYEPPECAAWREERMPAAPAVPNATSTFYEGVELPARLAVDGTGATFYDADGHASPTSGRLVLDASRARLAGFHAAGVAAVAGPPLLVPLVSSEQVAWDGELVVRAQTLASGTASFEGSRHPLAGSSEVLLRLRGAGRATPAQLGPQSWSVGPVFGDAVQLATDGTERLGAALRLLPDSIEAEGPAGNLTRVKLVLAEASGGADAHLTGYRIDASVKARYVGMEPFAMTAELERALRETEAGFATPAIVLTLGLALPFVAFAEAIAGIFEAFFPASVAGPLPAGEARLLTFELLMPDEPSEVEILLEARNAEPVRARIGLVPLPATG